MAIRNIPLPQMKTTLMMDALYFHAARQSHDRATKSDIEISNSKERWKELDRKWKEIQSTIHDPSRQYDLLEPIASQLESADYEIGRAYGIQIKEIATVHILACSVLEAHINLIAKERLPDKEYELFDRISLESKWLFLPKYISTETFVLGHEPFQSFTSLVKFRNKLVHFRGTSEDWTTGEAPHYIEAIGLTLKDSLRSINAVIGMIKKLSSILGEDPPYWLETDSDTLNYFSIDIKE